MVIFTGPIPPQRSCRHAIPTKPCFPHMAVDVVLPNLHRYSNRRSEKWLNCFSTSVPLSWTEIYYILSVSPIHNGALRFIVDVHRSDVSQAMRVHSSFGLRFPLRLIYSELGRETTRYWRVLGRRRSPVSHGLSGVQTNQARRKHRAGGSKGRPEASGLGKDASVGTLGIEPVNIVSPPA